MYKEPGEIDDITETYDGTQSERLDQGKKQKLLNNLATRTIIAYLFVNKHDGLEIDG